MEVIIGFALLGLFLFLGLKHKSNSFNSDARIAEIIEQAAAHSLELEQRIELLTNAAADYDRVCAELQATRQIAQSGVPLELHHQELNKERFALGNAISELAEVKEKLDASKGKQISERVRLGQVSEHVVGLLPDFPVDMKGMRFLGSPIDYVAFDFDKGMIYFIEVKTGTSKLSDRQKRVQQMVEDKKVTFLKVTVGTGGVVYE